MPLSLPHKPISSLKSYRSVWLTTLIVGLLQAFYAAGFIAKTSFVVEGKRYFCLFDDAMISMRYAANWAHGHGLVWNPGERVEGYTNFAWTMIMGLCHLLPLSPEHTCLLVQLLGIPILWSCLVVTVLLARSCRLLPLSACCAVLLGGTYYNLMFFSLFGMETGLVTCFVTIAIIESVKAIRQQKGLAAPMLWFALAILVRPDVLPLILFVFAYLLLTIREGRSTVTGGLLMVVVVAMLHALWRYHYYGDWLPNTYYLKATGWPLAQRLIPGLIQSLRTFASLGLPLLLAFVAILTLAKRWHFLILGLFVVSVSYQIYIGGDAWPLDRFVVPATIGLFVMAADGIHRTTTIIMSRKTGLAGMSVRGGLVLLCVAAINWTNWDHFWFIRLKRTWSRGWRGF